MSKKESGQGEERQFKVIKIYYLKIKFITRIILILTYYIDCCK
jgi:hypothetical protein